MLQHRQLHDREYLLLIKEEWEKETLQLVWGMIYVYYVYARFVKNVRRKSAITIEE